MSNDESQWVSVEIHNRMKQDDIHVSHSWLDCGKYYVAPDKEQELSCSEVDKITVVPGSVGYVSASGRKAAMKGTEGTFELYDGQTKICQIYFNCPYWSADNDFARKDYDPETSPYSVVVGPWNKHGGAIGNVSVTVSKMG